jgi:hypothetical protein
LWPVWNLEIIEDTKLSSFLKFKVPALPEASIRNIMSASIRIAIQD